MTERSGMAAILVLAVLLLGALLIVPLFGMTMWGPMMRGGMMGGWSCPIGAGCGNPTSSGWGFMFAAVLIPLVFIGILAVGVYFLLTSRSSADGSQAALKILDERYAKGEISKEQYLEMKQHLTKK